MMKRQIDPKRMEMKILSKILDRFVSIYYDRFINTGVICSAICDVRQCLGICSSYFCNENVCTQLVVSAIAECDFEENHLCGYVNRWNPNVNWFVGGGNIRNSQSILPKDHTLNSALGK